MTKIKTLRHMFLFKIGPDEDGRPPLRIAVKVRRGSRRVNLTLTADDVRQSIKAHGVGNAQTCSMALCARRQAEAFPHPVEGYIDWTYTRAYVVTRVDKNGQPSACVVYGHGDAVAKLNDSKDGQKALLRQLEDHGDMIIRLHPIRARPTTPGSRPGGANDGSRSSRPVGAPYRFIQAKLGLT